MVDRAGSGELDTLPAKRKSPPADGGLLSVAVATSAAPGAAGAPPRPHHRALCGPACSSPALGWGLRGGGGSCCDAEDNSCQATGESARGKSLRVCSGAAAEAAAAAAAPGSAEGAAAAGETQPLSCHGSSSIHPVSSMPPGGMYHSYHVGCCSRLSSSSSLAELEAAAMACEPAAEAASGWAVEPPKQLPDAHMAPAVDLQPQQELGEQQQQGQQQQQGGEEDNGVAVSYWADIPDDILKRVLERLAPSSLRVLRLVCHGWEAAASRLLRHLRPEALAGKQLGRRFPALHLLDLSNCCLGVDFTSPRMLRLQSLLLDEHLAELAGLHRLEQLSLRGCSLLTGLGLAQLGCLRGSLTMLNLSLCTGLRDECLGALAAAVPQLATLNLQGTLLGDDGVAHLVAMPHLRHVLLPAGVTDAAMLMLTEMPALERVALRGCSRVSTAGVYALLQRRGLKRVVISKCALVSLESLCGESNLKVVTDRAAVAATAADAALAGVALPLPLGAVAGIAGQDMQLLVAEV